MNGIIFDIQRFSVSDGPGIRTTVFMKGCHLRCRWCHNPEGLTGDIRLGFSEQKCLGCGRCAQLLQDDSMPSNAAGKSAGSAEELAAERCPGAALRVYGKSISQEELLSEILKDRAFYAQTGGVTFSGGEPTMQPEFLEAMLKLAKANGLHTAVDTCGFAPQQVYENIAAYTDVFLFDVKAASSTVHKAATGVENGIILSNLRYLGSLGKKIWIRIPLINGINANEAELLAIADILDSVKPCIERVTLIPYHALGSSKYHTLGLCCDDQDFSLPEGTAEKFEELFRTRGFNVEK